MHKYSSFFYTRSDLQEPESSRFYYKSSHENDHDSFIFKFSTPPQTTGFSMFMLSQRFARSLRNLSYFQQTKRNRHCSSSHSWMSEVKGRLICGSMNFEQFRRAEKDQYSHRYEMLTYSRGIWDIIGWWICQGACTLRNEKKSSLNGDISARSYTVEFAKPLSYMSGKVIYSAISTKQWATICHPWNGRDGFWRQNVWS